MRAGEGRASLRASRGREGEPPCEPGKGGRASVRAGEGRASLRASRGREGEPPCEPGKGGRASVRAGEGRASLRASRGREGEPPCEPGKGGRASVRAGEGRASLRASRGREGEPPCEPGKGGRASVRAGEGRASLRASRGREGEPPCEPAGIGEGSDGASPWRGEKLGLTEVLERPAESSFVAPDQAEFVPPLRRGGRSGATVGGVFRGSRHALGPATPTTPPPTPDGVAPPSQGGDEEAQRIADERSALSTPTFHRASLALPKWLNPNYARYNPRGWPPSRLLAASVHRRMVARNSQQDGDEGRYGEEAVARNHN